MQDEQNRHANPRSEDEEVEAHRHINPRAAEMAGAEGEGRHINPLSDDDDEVEAHRWGQHSPEDPGMRH